MRALPYRLPAESWRITTHRHAGLVAASEPFRLLVKQWRVANSSRSAVRFSRVVFGSLRKKALRNCCSPPRRLHRLKLDSQRQTQRWTALEDRVRNVPDSPERGFELALYSAVKGDDSFCHQAARWALGHRTEYRQSALVANWCEAAIDEDDRKAIFASRVPENPAKPFTAARDKLFIETARGEASRSSIRAQWAQLLPLIQRDPRVCLPEFYALFEFLDVADKSFRVDLRQDDGRLFANMPSVFLLSLSTGQLEKPDWETRIAGLMMVSVDPNLQGSSFVQGWAMEDPKTTTEALASLMNFYRPTLTCLGSASQYAAVGLRCAVGTTARAIFLGCGRVPR